MEYCPELELEALPTDQFLAVLGIVDARRDSK
jgi:hypothetical protein